MKKTVQVDWLDFFFPKPIKRQFVKNCQYLQTLDDIRKRGGRVIVVDVKPGGYLLEVVQDNYGNQTKSMGGKDTGHVVSTIGREVR